jgi:WD40 repeat protein
MNRALGFLALLTWLALPYLFWQSQQVRPRQTTLRNVPGPYGLQGALNKQASFSADARKLALVHGDTVTIWDVITGRKIGELSDPGLLPSSDTRMCGQVMFAPDGGRLVTLSWTGKFGIPGEARIWETASCSELFALKSVISVAYSPDGRFLATAAWDDGVRLLDPANGKEHLSLPLMSPFTFLNFSGDSKHLTVVEEWIANTVRVCDVVTGREECCFEPRVDGSCWNLSVVLTLQGRALTLHKAEKSVILLDLRTGQELARLRLDARDPDPAITCIDGKFWVLNWLNDNPHRERFAGWIGNARAERWFPAARNMVLLDGATGRELVRLPRVGLPAMLPDGQTLAMYCPDTETVELWDLPRKSFLTAAPHPGSGAFRNSVSMDQVGPSRMPGRGLHGEQALP